MGTDPARMIAASARTFRDPAERAAYLERVCRGIARLRADVDRILAEDARAEAVTAGAPRPSDEPDTASAPEPETAGAPPPHSADEAAARELPTKEPLAVRFDAARAPGVAASERPGDTIDRYRLVRELGQGGFGTVWLAEQFEPVRRQVALKILKLGMDTAQVVARFEQERQALALMDHPHVARVLDAGATAAGRPYFVMDLVQGEPIHEFCDRTRLSVDERLALFVQVCTAVQHAHMKGIIHRDLKPSNVLVGLRDGAPHATVIDFGIAKATSSRLTEQSLLTEQYQVIGTLQYMSPEQAQALPDVDTRTDVYSLGVILYELLTGSTPFAKETFDLAPLSEIQRKIREDDPAPPSSRITSTRDELHDLAEKRSTDAARLATLVRGDLDWIVLKAMEKERSRRYGSAEAFAADVRRYLAGEAVLAAPPSAGYLLGKFVRRHRGPVAAAAAVAAALVAGIVAFAWQAGVAGDERDAAILARESEAEQHRLADEQRDRALRAEADARARADELALVAEFQSGMLEQIDVTEAGRALTDDVVVRFREACVKSGVPLDAREAEVRAFQNDWSRVNATDAARDLIDRTILKPAIEAIDRKFRDQPLIDAQLRQVLAERYLDLGLHAEATPLQARALEIRRRLLGEESPLTLQSLRGSGAALVSAGKYAEAEAVVRDVLEKQVRVHGADSGQVAETRLLLATVVGILGRSEESEKLAREVVAWREAHLGPNHGHTVSALSILASSLQRQERFAESEAVFTDALRRATEGLGPDHPESMALVNNLGTLEQQRGRLAEAERYFRDLVDRRSRVSGDDHPNTLIALGNLGFVLRAQGKLVEAEPVIRESYERRRRTLGEEHPTTIFALHDLGELLAAQGRPADAEPCFRRAWEVRSAHFGDAHEATQSSLHNLCATLLTLGRPAEAETLLRSALERLRQALGESHEATLRALHELGAALAGTKPKEAEALLRQTIDSTSLATSTSTWLRIQSTAVLACLRARQDDADEAAAMLRDLLAATRDLDRQELVPALPAFQVVQEAFAARGDPKAAEALAREELQLRRATQGNDHPDTLDALNRLGAAMQRQENRAAEVEPLFREAYEGRLRTLGPEHPATLVSVNNMFIVLHELGRWADAEPFCRRTIEVLRRPGPKADPRWRESLANAVDAMGRILGEQGKFAEAEPYLRENLARLRRDSGDHDPWTVQAIRMLAEAVLALGRPAEAEPLLREALATADREAGPDSQYACELRNVLGTALWSQQKYDAAIAVFEDLAERIARNAGPDHPMALAAELNLAANLLAAGRVKESVRRFDDTIRRSNAAGPAAAANAAGFARSHAGALFADGQDERGAAVLREVADRARRREAPASLGLAQELIACAVVHLDARRWADAESLLREVLAIREAQAPDAWSTFNTRALIGETLLGQQRFAEAEPLVTTEFLAVLARESQIPPQGRPWVAKGRDRILRFYAAWAAAEPGKGHEAQLEEWKAKLAAPQTPAPAERR